MPKHKTKFKISKRPGPLGIIVETTTFLIESVGDKWKAQEDVEYLDREVNITIVIRGQKGQEYKMTMTLNTVDKEIKGTLKRSGINRIPRTYKLSTFNL